MRADIFRADRFFRVQEFYNRLFLFFSFSAAPLLQAQEEDQLSNPAEEISFVTCEMKGALGNQLFEIAATLAYAWDHGCTPIFPDLNRDEFRLSYNRDNFFFRLDSSDSPRPFSSFYAENFWLCSDKIPLQKDLKISGLFQSWKHFHHHRDQLLEVFAPSESTRHYLLEKYGDLISNPNTVSLHVRTFNLALHNSKLHPFLGLEYYRRAMDHFPSDTLFVVFSDRINWCKKHFPQLGKNFFFVESNNSIQDFFLMSMMQHQIIANSSFSWWAAYLNQNPTKRVIAPNSWMHPDLYAFPLVHPNGFYLTDWLMVRPNFREPYPDDMTLYDITQSLDGD